ncbi:hypothetical protein [Sagittula sp.]|uniref:hypothetical protein n=1 Tax=Sagittula sp. TaxID=2038081 RepID=UPI0035178E39
MRFENNEALKAWLRTQNQEVCVAIATRAALRVLPIVAAHLAWKDTDEARKRQESLVLWTARCSLISGVASTCPTPEIKSAAAAAAAATATATATSNAAAASAVSAAADSAVSAAATSAAALEKDCDVSPGEMFRQPLWHDVDVPEGLRPADLGPKLFDTDPRFAFFARWYDGMVRGEPLPWDLQERVALIPGDTWEAGADAVAKAIAEIERDWAARDPALTPVTETEISVVAQRVSANRDALAVSVASLLEQLDAFRERLRGMNAMDPDVRQELLDFVDGFRGQLEKLLLDLPAPGEDIEEDRANRLVLWLRDYRGVLKTKLVQYASPENFGDATVPTAIILGATGVGAMMGAPLAGAAVGGLIVNQMKPGDAAKVLLKPDPAPDSNSGSQTE